MHLANFIDAVRTRQPSYETAEVGHRAAAAGHMVNLSIAAAREWSGTPTRAALRNFSWNVNQHFNTPVGHHGCPPVAWWAEGLPADWHWLLLVVDRGEGDLLAFRVGAADGDGAGLAIGRQYDFAGERCLPVFLVGQIGGVVIHRLVRPGVG